MKRFLRVVWVGLFAVAVPTLAANVYVYKDSRGSVLITDRPQAGLGYRLMKTYRTVFGAGHSPRRVALKPRQSTYDPLIHRIANRHGVDETLVKAMMQVESAFDPFAVSPRGATGLMQLMPATAARYGVSDIENPAQNIDGGVRYLRDLLDEFDQNTRLALAAYNAGENAVTRYNGVPPYNETRDYVRKVLDLHRLYSSR